MRNIITFTLVAAAGLFCFTGTAAAGDGGFNEMNLPYGVEPPPSDHELTPGPEAAFTFPSDDSTVVGSIGFIGPEQVGYFWSVARSEGVSSE